MGSIPSAGTVVKASKALKASGHFLSKDGVHFRCSFGSEVEPRMSSIVEDSKTDIQREDVASGKMGAVHYPKGGSARSILPDLRFLPFNVRPIAPPELRTGLPPKHADAFGTGMPDRTPVIASRRFRN